MGHREVRDIALELWRELLLPQQTGQLFIDLALSKRYDIRLPLQILFGRVCTSILAARRRKLLGGLDHFAQALLSWTRFSKNVCEPISRLGFLFNQAREEFCKRIWIVTSRYHRKQSDAIRFKLLFRLVT